MQTPLEVIVDGLPCKSIILKSTSGKIEKNLCDFYYRSNRIGGDTITVYGKINGKLKKLGSSFFNINEIPDPEVVLGGLKKGHINKGALIAQHGLGASYIATSYGHRENIPVKSFTVIIIRNDSVIFSGINNGNIFAPEIKVTFESLLKDDKLIFANITATNYNLNILCLRPIEFIIN